VWRGTKLQFSNRKLQISDRWDSSRAGHAGDDRLIGPVLGSNMSHLIVTNHFLRSRYCWERVLAVGILSLCLSGVPRPGTESSPGEIETPGFHRMIARVSIVSNEVIWCRWVRRFPSNEGIKEGYLLRNRNFTTIRSSSVRTVADRRSLAAYHHKHCWRACWRAFRWYQHRWPWTTFKPKIGVLVNFFAIWGCHIHFKSELRRDHWR